MSRTLRPPHIPKFDRVARAFDKAQEIAETAVAQFAEDESEAFKTRIETQDFTSFDASPLSPKYFARKVKLGLDPRVMIRRGDYVEKIRVFRKRPSKRKLTLYVGFHKRLLARDDRGRRTPFLMERLAWVQERGSAKMHIPPRAHWGPHYQEMHWRAVPLRQRIKNMIRASAKKIAPGIF